MNKGGRPSSTVWQYFYKVERQVGEKLIVQAKCKNCGHVQSNKSERMLNHAKKCCLEVGGNDSDHAMVPGTRDFEHHTNEVAAVKSSDVTTNKCLSASGNAAATTSAATESLAKRSRLQTDLKSFVQVTDAKTKHQIDLQVAKYFFANNI